MNADWPIVQLGEHCMKVGSGATPRGGASVYLDDGEVCLIRSQNVYNDGFKPEGLVYITEESASKLKNVIVESNDILLNITGDSVARVCLAHDSYLPARVNQHVAIIRPEPTSFDARYLRYLFVSPTMQRFLLTIAAVGATRNALTKGMIETLGVPKPPLELQRAIADKLDSLDNKIELNRQINQTLEQITQAIFKSWFVDFEPTRAKIIAKEQGADPATQELAAQAIICGAITLEQLAELEQNLEATLQQAIDEKLSQGNQTPIKAEQLKATAALFPNELVESELGEIPEGWGVKALDEIAHYQNGLALQRFRPEDGEDSLPVLKIAQLRRGFADGKERASVNIRPECIVDNGDVIFSWSGSLIVDIWCGGKVALNQHLFKVTSQEYPKWFYYYWTKHHLEVFQRIAADKAVTMGHIKRGHLSQAKCLIPSSELLQEVLIKGILDKKILLRLESFSLEEVRDTLLPKLLSGELAVTDNSAPVIKNEETLDV